MLDVAHNKEHAQSLMALLASSEIIKGAPFPSSDQVRSMLAGQVISDSGLLPLKENLKYQMGLAHRVLDTDSQDAGRESLTRLSQFASVVRPHV